MCCRRLIGLGLVLIGLVGTTAARGETNSWPQWLGPQRDGSSREVGLLKQWPSGGPRRIWLTDQAGLGYSGPAIVGDTIFTMGSEQGSTFLFALDAADGSRRWACRQGNALENDWGDGPRSTPTVDGDRVYALSANGMLVCCASQDGKLLWQRKLQDVGGEVPFWGYSESPLVDGDQVVCTPGGAQGAVVAFDKYTGEIRWQSRDVTDEAQYTSIVRAAPAGEGQYVVLLQHRVFGLAATSGQLLWEAAWAGNTAVIPTPIYHEGHLYVTSGYGVGCQLLRLDATGRNAELIYDNKVMKNKHGGVVRVGDYVYGYSDARGWVCQSWATGEKMWHERRALGRGSICYADGMLYCLAEDEGEVVLLEATPEAWRERSRFTLDPQTTQRKEEGRIWTHPVVVNGRLYLRVQELLFCYDVKTSPAR